MSGRVYLAHNATSPLRSEARDAMIAALDCIGNPSSIHAEGRAARAIIEDARETVARVFGVKPSNVYFASGGTEAANWLLQPQEEGQTLAAGAVEHPCVLSGHRFPADRVRIIPVSQDGVLDLAAFEAAISPGAVAAIQVANNETGIIQPLEDVARLTRAKGATLICDAVQAVGRLPLRDLEPADVFFLSAHKFGGPKGVGAAILKGSSFSPQPLIKGGGQERRQRSGTENVPGIAGLAAALEAAVFEQAAFAAHAKALQHELESGLRAAAPDAVIFGERTRRLPNTTCFAIPGKSAGTLLIAFDLEGIAISSGSACSSGKAERSHVLEAMGVAQGLSGGAIRVSSGWTTAKADIERFLTALSKICSGRQARHAA
ncbi:MAG: cysteine desulfurase [Rhodomicrobium sp.]|nr:cysteine desulfurase [Rhodomicrobium sp.]